MKTTTKTNETAKTMENTKSTKNIKVPEKLVDQVIGQDEAVRIIKKAA